MDTAFSVSSIALQSISSAGVVNAAGVDVGERVQATDDDGSSSLSELGERAGIENFSRAGTEANDTEAETERLEDSPQKQRRQRDMVLTSTNGTYGDHQNHSVAGTVPRKITSRGSSSNAEKSSLNWLTVP